ncbi:MAG TPA: hypothetical protein VG939_19950 [Caulobacteraceae bacterium]|nr:hypothetical protein [Caulobacteraceae bacterium]
MTEYDRALEQISALRSQMARATEFRGYGPRAFAITAALAGGAALAQAAWLPDPAANTGAWLGLWTGVAALSAVVIGVEMVGRSRRIHSSLAGDMLRAAVEQFLPAAVAGGAITAVLALFAPQSLWMMPGLWQVVFALGVFASCRFLPRAIAVVGFWYLGTGLLCLAFASGPASFAPWAMGVPFAVGQALVAAVLRLSGDDAHAG